MASTLRSLLGLAAIPSRHRYGSHGQNRCDLYVPRGDGPFPVAITIHGGYWGATYGKWTMHAIAADLRHRGHAVWNIEYRRLGRGQGGGWPATFDDVAAGIDRLAGLEDPRIDLGNATLIGHSAGGQLALWAASRKDSAVPIARVVAQAPVTEMRTVDVAHELMGGSPERVPERYAAVNPIQLVPPPVPALVVHGPGDATIPVRRSREYVEAARAAGGDVELVEAPGGHRAHVDPRTEAWRVTAEWILR